MRTLGSRTSCGCTRGVAVFTAGCVTQGGWVWCQEVGEVDGQGQSGFPDGKQPLSRAVVLNAGSHDCSARKLSDEARTAIVNYFSVYKVSTA